MESQVVQQMPTEKRGYLEAAGFEAGIRRRGFSRLRLGSPASISAGLSWLAKDWKEVSTSSHGAVALRSTKWKIDGYGSKPKSYPQCTSESIPTKID